MITIASKEMCCGCGACEQICPKKSIHMECDSEGFLYPLVNRKICIECGQCTKICPVLNARELDNRIIMSYIGYDKTLSDRLTSSSGGLFGLLATHILEQSGLVYGAAFDNDFSVHHIRIDNITQLAQIKGSKYVQSDIQGTYSMAKKDLDAGRKVLFSGTACQIAGLKRFVGGENENLMTVDILCHGVPSPLVWKVYLNWLINREKSEIRSINFRNKTNGWKKYMMNVDFLNNKTYCVPHNSDPFMQVFLSNVCLRPSCHDCRFKKLHRMSDITLGDAWDIGRKYPNMDDDKGTSLVIIHTENGEECINKLRSKIELQQEEIDVILPPGSDSRISVTKHPKRGAFFIRINQSGTKAFDWWNYTRKRTKQIYRIKKALLYFAKTCDN